MCQEKDLYEALYNTFRDVLCKIWNFSPAFLCITWNIISVQGELCTPGRGPSVCLISQQYSLHGLIQRRTCHWEVLAASYFSEAPVLQMNGPRFVAGTLHLLSLTLSSCYRQACSLKWIQIHAGNKDHGLKHRYYDPLRTSLCLLQT